jgi:NAD+ kinase
LLRLFYGEECVGKDPCLDIRTRLRINFPNGNSVRKLYRGGQLEKFEEMNIKDYHVVNEVVIDRGPSPFSVQLEIYIDDIFFTTCVGDGLIISTPTGSTAYNLSAGGSIVQSNVPSISLTPLAPHSLSFRPLILPENCTITISKAKDNRTPAWVSIDGATRMELSDGESLSIQASPHRLAFVTDPSDNLNELWAKRLTKLLNWNVRPYMKPLKKNVNSEI